MKRALAGSRPGTRTDGARVALAVEGGGTAGAITGSMCAALESLGLINSFDVVYGSSAGAINASYAVAGQARDRSELYVLASRLGIVDMRRILRLRPPFRLADIGTRLLEAYPHDPSVLGSPLSLRLTAARVEDKRLDVLSDFASLAELRTALLASCANPVLAGDTVEFRGRSYVDGGLIESVPFRAALREGSTHVLVLRSRHAGYLAPEFRRVRRHVLSRVLREAPATAAEMVFEWPARYNADASDLQTAASAELAGPVTQLCPPAGNASTSSYESRPARLRQRMALGAMTIYGAFGPLLTQAAHHRPQLDAVHSAAGTRSFHS